MPRDYRVFLITDDPARPSILEQILLDAAIPHRLVVTGSGPILLATDTIARATPDLIVVDLAGLEEIEILSRIKQAPHLGAIPVVIPPPMTLDRDKAGFARSRDLLRTLHAVWREANHRREVGDRPAD